MHLSEKDWKRLWATKPLAVADCVVIKNNKILLTKRAIEPFKGYWVLPGGLMEVGETIEQTAIREVEEETGVTAKIILLIGVYSGPHRDPRGTSMSAAFLLKPVKIGKEHDHEVSEVKFFPFDKIPKKLGFDHKKIIKDALKLLRKNQKA